MKNFITFFLLIFLLISHESWGQDHFYEVLMSKRKLAYRHYKNKNYSEAANYFMYLYYRNKLKNKDMSLLADCLYKTNQKNKALKIYHSMDDENIEFDQKSENQYFVSMINDGMFEKAWQWYYKKDTVMNESVFFDHKIDSIEPMNINSSQDDYGPAPFKLGLLYLSTRPTYSLIKTPADNYPQSYFANLAEDGSLGDPQKFNFPFWPEASLGGFTIFNQGKKMIISAMPFSARNKEKHYSLYYCENTQNEKWELKYELDLGEGNFLQPYYLEKEQKLFFAANLNEESGTDLYYCNFVPEAEKLTPVKLNENINTPGNELYPYIHQDSLLIFASNGHFGLGGLDLYQVNLNDKKLEIQNFGAPINSSKDDYGLIYYPLSRFGFFSTNRNQQGDDIYKFYLN